MELCSDAKAFAVCQHLDSIADAVDHAVVCIIEQAELKFNHVSVFGIESRYVYKPLKVAYLISLLESQFSIVTFFRLDAEVRIDTHSSDILAKIFLVDGRVAVTLSGTGADKAVIG